jgi:hypothetical protein
MKLTCPVVWAATFEDSGDSIRQLQTPIVEVDGTGVPYTRRTISGIVFRPTSNPENEILIVDRRIEPPANFARVIRSPNLAGPSAAELDCRDATWLRHPNQTEIDRIDQLDGFAANALHSWANGFNFIKEDIANGIRGLRNPQIGALHGVLAHWSVSNEVATVVMPTGTGKTETMLSLLLAVPCHRVLVIVPTDALRTQIADKFISLGILKPTGVASHAARYPVVGILRHRPATPHLTEELFTRCNVVVTTSQIAGQPKRSKDSEATRFQKGTKEELYRIKESSRSATLRARIIIVQPSLSKSGASDPQLELLAVTENYLSETLQLPLTVIASP